MVESEAGSAEGRQGGREDGVHVGRKGREGGWPADREP